MKTILITGSLGQLGSELALALRDRYGNSHVILTDLRDDVNRKLIDSGPFYQIDCRDGAKLVSIIAKHGIDTIFHLAALLSATSEQNPQLAWDINMGGSFAVLEAAREMDCAVFTPSSIGAFGPNTPKAR